MENASKALIIAGAILLSILIISLGIMVYQNSKNTVGSANLNKQEIETFNSQWEAYIGTNKTASEVRTMISAVIASNAAENKNGRSRFVNVTHTGTAGTTAPTWDSVKGLSLQNVPSNTTYEIKAGFDANGTGLIVGLDWK